MINTTGGTTIVQSLRVDVNSLPDTAIGMPLRDWFAGMAMQQQVNNPLTVSNADSRSAIAERAYAMADEMLKARGAK